MCTYKTVSPFICDVGKGGVHVLSETSVLKKSQTFTIEEP